MSDLKYKAKLLSKIIVQKYANELRYFKHLKEKEKRILFNRIKFQVLQSYNREEMIELLKAFVSDYDSKLEFLWKRSDIITLAEAVTSQIILHNT